MSINMDSNSENPNKQQPLTRKELRQLELQRRQQENRERQKLISRREFLKKLFVAGGVLLGGGIVWQIGSRREEQPRPATPPLSLDSLKRDYQDKELRLNSVLERVDQAFVSLEETLHGKLQSISEEDRAALMAPIETYKVNKKNIQRNKYSILISDLEARGEGSLRSPTELHITDLNYFFIQLIEDKTNVAAAFAPISRTVHLNGRFDPNNLLDALVVYHEIEHARQDAQVRMGLDTPQRKLEYNSFYTTGPGQRGRIIGAFEQEAYLKEVMVLDLLTDGRLREDAYKGKLDIDFYQQRLNVQQDQREILRFVLDGARIVYTSDTSLKSYAPSFVNFMNQQYKNRDFEIYAVNNNRLERVP